MLRTARGLLLAGCLTLAAAAAAAAQTAAPPDKQAAVAKLLELEDPQARAAAAFSRVMDRFRDMSAGMMIKGMRADGLFSKLSAAEGAEFERRLRVFEDDVFSEFKASVLRDAGQGQDLTRALAVALARDFTAEELNEAVAFDQSPLGRKLLAGLPGALAENTVAVMEAKGFFAEQPSPEATAANLARLNRETMADPAAYAHQIYEGAFRDIEKLLTPDEVKELRAFSGSDFGRKYAEVHSRLHGEVMRLVYGRHAQQNGALMNEIHSRKLKEYAPWLSEASRPGALGPGPKVPQPGRRDQPPAGQQGRSH